MRFSSPISTPIISSEFRTSGCLDGLSGGTGRSEFGVPAELKFLRTIFFERLVLTYKYDSSLQKTCRLKEQKLTYGKSNRARCMLMVLSGFLPLWLITTL